MEQEIFRIRQKTVDPPWIRICFHSKLCLFGRPVLGEHADDAAQDGHHGEDGGHPPRATATRDIHVHARRY